MLFPERRQVKGEKGMRKCPGQDSRFWKPKDVKEVDCGSCGRELEFFKTEPSRRCPGCGKRIINPSVSLGCAQWCQHAGVCLGFDPHSVTKEDESGKEKPMVQELIGRVKEEFGADQNRISHSIQVLEIAEKIMEEEEASPRITLAAALLHDIGIKEAERIHGSAAPPFQELEGRPVARRILENLGFNEDEIEHIFQIIANHHSGMEKKTSEFRVVRKADRLADQFGEDSD